MAARMATRAMSFSTKSNKSTVPIVFDRHAKRIQRSNAAFRASRTTSSSEFLREEIARRVLDRLEDVQHSHRHALQDILELGTGFGSLSKLLVRDIIRGRKQANLPSVEDFTSAQQFDYDDNDSVDNHDNVHGSHGAGFPSALPGVRTLFLTDSSEPMLRAAVATCKSVLQGDDKAPSPYVALHQVEVAPAVRPGMPGQLRARALEENDEQENGDKGAISPVDVRPVLADEEALPFAPESLDLVVSNLALHWCNDLPGVFAQIYRALRPDGIFIASLFGEHTLNELRSAFALAEQERDGGVAPHVSPFVGVADIGNLLTRARFALPTVDHEELTVHYSDAFKLMEDLRAMGENNAVASRRAHTPRDTIIAAAAVYAAMFGTQPNDTQGVPLAEVDESRDEIAGDGTPAGALPATFQVVYLIAWKPAPTQQKPLRRGSATHSLRDLGDSGVIGR